MLLKYLISCVIIAAMVHGQHHWIHQCPLCTDPYDHTTCTSIRDCHNTHEVCLFKLDLGLNNRVDYHCTNFNLCESYASQPCNFSLNQTCYFCCLDVPSCNQQREALFMGITHG